MEVKMTYKLKRFFILLNENLVEVNYRDCVVYNEIDYYTMIFIKHL